MVFDADRRVRSLYEAFNARDIESALSGTTDDVDWPNGWEGGREHGQEAVRRYWTRQWAEIDPHVQPSAIATRPDGRVEVQVHQLVRDRDGRTLSDGRVVHVYTLRDGLVARMDIE